RADENFWKAEYERDKRLYKAKALNASQFDRTRMKYRVTQAKLKLIETQIGYATIKALIDGWVSERMIYPGVYVKKGSPLLKIEHLDRVRIHFDVAEKDLLHFHKGTPVYLRFPQVEPKIIRQAFSDYLRNRKSVQLVSLGEVHNPESEDHIPQGGGRVLRAEVSVVFPSEDHATRTGIVEVRLPNPGAVLKSNTYVMGDLVRAHAKKAVRVPQSALVPIPGGKTVVFVGPAFADQGPAEAREVQVGVRGKRFVQILKGVKSGEFVIYEGNRGLTDGENVMVVRREGGP
ncbi:MAG: efflux RND transporter periplasmic adaptor subunit, partial [Candidatus Binatia bacterium]